MKALTVSSVIITSLFILPSFALAGGRDSEHKDYQRDRTTVDRDHSSRQEPKSKEEKNKKDQEDCKKPVEHEKKVEVKHEEKHTTTVEKKIVIKHETETKIVVVHEQPITKIIYVEQPLKLEKVHTTIPTPVVKLNQIPYTGYSFWDDWFGDIKTFFKSIKEWTIM